MMEKENKLGAQQSGTGDGRREQERRDALDADTPTATEENESMSTILSVNPVDGVQDDARDE